MGSSRSFKWVIVQAGETRRSEEEFSERTKRGISAAAAMVMVLILMESSVSVVGAPCLDSWVTRRERVGLVG